MQLPTQALWPLQFGTIWHPLHTSFKKGTDSFEYSQRPQPYNRWWWGWHGGLRGDDSAGYGARDRGGGGSHGPRKRRHQGAGASSSWVWGPATVRPCTLTPPFRLVQHSCCSQNQQCLTAMHALFCWQLSVNCSCLHMAPDRKEPQIMISSKTPILALTVLSMSHWIGMSCNCFMLMCNI